MRLSQYACTLCSVTVAVVAAPAVAGAAVISTFDSGDEGWRVYGDAEGASDTPDHHLTGGNPGGYVSADDDVAGGTWYWQAPEKFLGNRSGAYGTDLLFDLRQTSTSAQFENSDVVLIGANGTTLAFDTATHPGTDWTHYAVTIDAAAGWRIGSLNGAIATQSDIEGVLADLDVLRIRGEFRTGSDTGSLDNVQLVPEPASLAMLAGAGLLLGRSRRPRQ